MGPPPAVSSTSPKAIRLLIHPWIYPQMKVRALVIQSLPKNLPLTIAALETQPSTQTLWGTFQPIMEGFREGAHLSSV